MKTKPPVVKPSISALRKINSAALFNPREDGPMSIIADVASVEYYKHSAALAIKNNDFLEAHQMLLLARYYSEQGK